MIYLLMMCSVFCGTGKNMLSKMCKMDNVWKFNTTSFLTAFFIIGFSYIGKLAVPEFSVLSVSFAVLYAVLTISGQFFYIKSVEHGSVTVNSLIYSFGFTIPTVLGTVIWHESVSVCTVIGLALMIASLFLGVSAGKEISNGKSIIFAFSAMICSGAVGLVQKLYNMLGYKDKINIFLIEAFFVMFLISLLITFKTEKFHKRKEKGIVFFPVAMGICIAYANKINIYLSGALPSIVMFPVVNGGCVVLTSIASRLFFSDELTFRKKAAILLGVISIILIVI